MVKPHQLTDAGSLLRLVLSQCENTILVNVRIAPGVPHPLVELEKARV